MRIKKLKITVVLFLTILSSVFAQKHELISPNHKIQVSVTIDDSIALKILNEENILFSMENIAMHLKNGIVLGESCKVRKTKTTHHNNTIFPVIREKVAQIKDVYNELKIEFKGRYSLFIRAYNNGVSYRFATSFKKEITITEENAQLTFNQKDSFYFQENENFKSSYEAPYKYDRYTKISKTNYINLPFLVKSENGPRILVTESNLEDYPGLWFQMDKSHKLKAVQPRYPIAFLEKGKTSDIGQVKERANYIAKTQGTRSFPWRVFVIAQNDADLLINTLVYQLAKPLQIKDPSWIQSGIATFDWWGKKGIYGTDFKAGINTATAKYFIDFASNYGFEYFLFDDGWSESKDLTKITPDLNLKEIVAYAKKKNVKIMLWVTWYAINKDLKANLNLFKSWGIAGIKCDFMKRDDQKMVQFYHKLAKETAKREMVLDFHGAYKPTGLRRAYPNVLTREALIEFAYNTRGNEVSPIHDNLLPYLRMVTGPMDYIPYTTNNAQKNAFRPNNIRPMGQGTRAHSLAMSIILESPMRMLPDSPSDYYKEDECTTFFSKIPVEWDDLKVLQAKAGAYTIIARKRKNEWFVGAITDWKARDFEIPFDFLDDGVYTIEYIEDGINASTRSIDYKKHTVEITANSKKQIHLAQGGGWLARIIKKEDN